MFGNFHGMLILSQRSRKYYDILLRIPSEKITAYHSKAKSYKLRKPQLNTLRKKCPYSELFWSAFSRIRSEYGEILGISPYSVRVRENTDQNNSEYGHFLRSTELELSKVQTGHIFDWIFGRNKLISEYFERKF